MALPSSGQITLAQIRDEFGPGTTSNVNLRTLSSAAGLSQPDQFSDFYGLSAYTVPTLSGVSYTGNGTQASPYVFTYPLGGGTYNNYYECYTGPNSDAAYADFYHFRFANANVRFENQVVADQKAHVTITSLNTSGLCTTYNYGYFAWAGGPIIEGTQATTKIYYANGSTNGATLMKNDFQNKVWDITGYYATRIGQAWEMNTQIYQDMRTEYYLYCECPECGVWYSDNYCNQTFNVSTYQMSVWFELA